MDDHIITNKYWITIKVPVPIVTISQEEPDDFYMAGNDLPLVSGSLSYNHGVEKAPLLDDHSITNRYRITIKTPVPTVTMSQEESDDFYMAGYDLPLVLGSLSYNRGVEAYTLPQK